MAKKKKFFAHFAVRKHEGNPTSTFAYGEEKFVDDVATAWVKKTDPPSEKLVDITKPDPDFTHESALTDALSRAVDFGLSQYQLIQFVGQSPAILSGIMAAQHAVFPTISEATLVRDAPEFSIYGLTVDQYDRVVIRHDEVQQLRAGVKALPSACLLSIVATFDTLIVDVLGKMLTLSKEWLDKSDRTIAFARLSSASCLEELVTDAVSDELYQFSRGSHDEQARYIETTFGVGIRGSWKRWADYIEIFERRNLVAHGERAFNKRYVSICSAAGHKGSDKLLGSSVDLTNNYLNQALEVLLEFAVLLPFVLWRKLARDREEQAFEALNEAAFKLISNKRPIVADRVLEFALTLEKTGVSASVRQMLVVNRASAIHHDGRKEQAEKVLDEMDWSASADIFKMCVASIRGDADTVAKLMPATKAAGALHPRAFRNWPCFSFVRENQIVRDKFLEVFGEPMSVVESGVRGAGTAQAEEKGDESPAKTMH